MSEINLIFIPSPAVGHLTSTIEIAKILLDLDHGLSITFIIKNFPNFSVTSIISSSASDRLDFIELPNDDSVSTNFFNRIEFMKPVIMQLIQDRINSKSVHGLKLAGLVIDMFYTSMIDIADELGVPSYVYYTSGASFLALLFHVQKLCDNEGLDIADFENSDVEFSLPGFSNMVPARLLPSAAFDKEHGFSGMIQAMGKEFRRTDGILVNSFIELESYAVQSMRLDSSVPTIYTVGPVVNMDSKNELIKEDKEKSIMKWLDKHPPASVVFLCFGSKGAFGPDQVKEIANGIESTGCRFLWSLRRPSSSQALFAPPEEYEDFSMVLPEGFLERTSGIGKVIGWAPQAAVLGHPAVGGFVSHCGWNSTLESLWFGKPIATWPLYAEQQFNAFEAVNEMGIGVEISVDYRVEMSKLTEAKILGAEKIERGIRELMEEESEVRKKAKVMKEKCREAVVEGGSSYTNLGHFLDDLRKNIGL